jgi:hypothetical protein
MYDERVETYRQEKKKTEKLLTDLLPRQVSPHLINYFQIRMKKLLQTRPTINFSENKKFLTLYLRNMFQP